MGTSYELHCVTCRETHWFGGCRDVDGLLELAKNAPLIAALRGLDVDLTVALRCDGTDRLDLKWFDDHAGHELDVRNEYGELLSECGERFGCEVCGYRPKRCRRRRGHEGGHSYRRD